MEPVLEANINIATLIAIVMLLVSQVAIWVKVGRWQGTMEERITTIKAQVDKLANASLVTMEECTRRHAERLENYTLHINHSNNQLADLRKDLRELRDELRQLYRYVPEERRIQ